MQKAVSNVTGHTRLFLSEENAGDHRIFDSNDGRQYIEVDSIRLEEHFADFTDTIDLVKMDIQGAEYFALQGMQEMIQRKSIDPAPIDRLSKEYRLDKNRFTNLLCLKNGDKVPALFH